jgi:hypothetical protein
VGSLVCLICSLALSNPDVHTALINGVSVAYWNSLTSTPKFASHLVRQKLKTFEIGQDTRSFLASFLIRAFAVLVAFEIQAKIILKIFTICIYRSI